MYKKINNFRKNIAVSEVISVIFLIAIAILVFVVLHSQIISDTVPSIQPPVTLVGKLEGDKLIIEHSRGPSLSLDTTCIVNIGGFSNRYSAKDLLNSKSKENDLWNIGERLVYELGDITYLKVTCSIIDNKQNVVLYDHIIQDGMTSQYPYLILTLNPTNIENGSAKLWLAYNFRNYSGSVRFSYKQLESSWINTSWIPKSDSGVYNETISSLSTNNVYIYRAQLICNSNIINGEEISILQNGVTSVNNIIPYEIPFSPLTITASGDSQLDDVTLYYRWSGDNTSWEDSSGDITWLSELLINPSFETGDTTGWSNGGGGTMIVGTNCPWGSKSPYEGSYYSYWLVAGENVNAYAYQNVNLESYASYIDAGLAKINVTGWFVSDEYNYGGSPPYDEFYMNVGFYNSSDGYMSGYGYQSGGTNPIYQGSGNHVDTWAQYGITNYTIPIGARKVQVSYYTWEYDGSTFYDAGSADKFSVKVGIVGSINNWNVFGTDNDSPWSWSFNFPYNEGYYQFYSIGTYKENEEEPPNNPDALCLYNAPRVIDSFEFTFEFDTDKGKYPSIIHVSGDIYAIAYSGDSDDGYVTTIEIKSNGSITKTVIDYFEFDTEKGKYPSIIHISGDIYAIAYSGDSDDGYLITIEINPSGTITQTVIDSLEFDIDKGLYPSIKQVSGNVYAIAYTGDGDDGLVKTVRIDASGNILDTVLDAYEFDTEKGKYPSIIHISGDIYAIAYSGDSDDGYVKTLNIAIDGFITPNDIDSLEFDIDKGLYPSIKQVSGNVYAIAYTGDGDDGLVKTVRIDASGNILDTVLDAYEFDTDKGKYPSIIHVSGDIYAIAYSGDSDDGYLITIIIASDGTITQNNIDTFEYDTDKALNPSIVDVFLDIYVIAFCGDGDDGYVKTIEIGFNGDIK